MADDDEDIETTRIQPIEGMFDTEDDSEDLSKIEQAKKHLLGSDDSD